MRARTALRPRLRGELVAQKSDTAGPWKLSTSFLSLHKEAARPRSVARKRLRNVNHTGPIVAATLDDVRR
jgi:hypothetical protein